MHPAGVDGLVVPQDILRRDLLPEIRLEAVHALVEQAVEAVGVPRHRLGVGKVDQAHARLPQVPLPDVTVGAPEQVAPLGGVPERRTVLGDVGVDPHADLAHQARRLEPRDLRRRVREALRVEDEVGPGEGLHPEAVVVEHVDGAVARAHALEERRHRRLVVLGREARRQPQAVAPRGHRARPARQPGVAPQHGLGRRPVHQDPLEALALDAGLDAGAALAAHLELDALGRVDEDAVAAAAQPKGHVLVGLVARRAAVGVPQHHALPDLVESAEALAQPVHRLARG